MAINVFFVLMELFTAIYSGIPEHIAHFKFLYFGLEGHTTLVPWMWTSAVLSVVALTLLINPRTRRNETLPGACLRRRLPGALDREGPRPDHRRVRAVADGQS